jgi:hypothetical protein
MYKMSEFKVNDFITLKLENDNTEIYVKGEKILSCKKIAINIPLNKLDIIYDVKSIDDLENINYKEIKEDCQITPKVEFFVHCSNLQAWAENEYDTRLIHSNLAFPLLKKLSEVGNPQAKKIFKEEIVKRFVEGNKSVREFLIVDEFIDLLNSEEIDFILNETLNDEAQHIKIIETKLKWKAKIVNNVELHKGRIELLHNQVYALGLAGSIRYLIPKEIRYFKSLKKLMLNHFLDQKLPSWLG